VAAPPGKGDWFRPVRVLDVELSEPLPAIARSSTTGGAPVGRVRVLVRVHTWPLGFVEMELGADGVSGGALAAAIEMEIGTLVRRHLRLDGVDPAGRLEEGGIGVIEEPRCLEARRETLRDPISVSVVVPTVDRPDALRRCIQDVVDQSYPELEILVVDNDPVRSGAALAVASINTRGRPLRYLVESRRGASRARNRGLKHASGEIVAFIDGDVRVDESWLAALATSMRSPLDHGGFASCVTGAILPLDLQTQAQHWMEEWGGYSKGFESRVFDLRDHRLRSPLYPFAAAVFGSGANMSFRTAELRQMGGFDVALGPGMPSRGGEDLAAFLDIVSGGGSIVYEPGAIVWHEHPSTEAQFRSKLHSYGVGLSSLLSRHASRHPVDALRMAAAIPAAASYFFRSDSAHNAKRSSTFPRGLWRVEVAGMIRGPFAYAVGRAQGRKT